MENTDDSQAKIRWRKVAAALPEATDPDRVIGGPPGAESYKPQGAKTTAETPSAPCASRSRKPGA